MKVLNLLSSGDIGGIEVLCRDIARYSDYKNSFCFLFSLGEIYNEMLDDGADVIDLTRNGKKISLRKMIRLRELAEQHDIVVVHHGSFLLQLYFWILAKTTSFPKYVLTSHSCFERKTYYYNNPIKTWMRRSVLVGAINSADKIVYVSKAGRQSFLDDFEIPIEKTAIVYNGISEKLINDGHDNIPKFEGKLNVLYVGRLVDVKGVDLLIEAVARLKEELPIDLTIVGYGEKRADLEKQVRGLSLTEYVHFEGSQRNVGLYYKSANVFVYPSICKEVFGISIVEAMAYGLPVIANDVGGISEIIDDGKNGYLTNEADPMEIARLLKNIYTIYINGDSINMINNAKYRACSFSINKTIRNLQEIYSELLQ